jgi:hypothetical protein
MGPAAPPLPESSVGLRQRLREAAEVLDQSRRTALGQSKKRLNSLVRQIALEPGTCGYDCPMDGARRVDQPMGYHRQKRLIRH